MLELFGVAFAQTPTGTPSGPASALTSFFFPLAVVVAIFYFLLIRPNQKQAQAKDRFLAGLKKGDEVVTTGGLYGKVHGIAERVITLEVAENVRIKVAREHVAGPRPEEKA